MSTSRRNFLKASGAAGIFACLPAIEVRQGVPMELLERCCDTESYRYAMDAPFIEGANASATDGKIGVRVFDSMGLADTEKPLRFPPLGRAFDQLWKPQSHWQDWPAAEYQPTEHDVCYLCNGRGYEGALYECKTCDGAGDVIPPNVIADAPFGVYCERCPDCASGWVSDDPCKRCNGKPFDRGLGGKMPMDDDLCIASGFHHLVSRFPGVRWNIGNSYESDRGGPVVLFEFEGGQGMVMPLRSDV